MATNGERGGQCNPLIFLRGLKDKVEVQIEEMEKTLAINSRLPSLWSSIDIYTSMLQTRIENLERAWTEFKAQ